VALVTRPRTSGRGVDVGMNWRFVWRTMAPALLPLWFAAFAVRTVVHFASNDLIGIDLAIYRHAAEVALAGGNPWIPDSSLPAFAAPPPTLLMYVPLAFLPLPLATILMFGACIGGAIWAIRRLGIPLWWLLFPPLFDALLVANPDALVLPLLLLRGPLSGLAPALKIYAVVPLLLERRLRALVVAAAVCALSLPELPHFLDALPTVNAVLGASAKLSAWGVWWLGVPVVIALWRLRRRGAEYLVVPALWPNTQSQYGTMALACIHRYPIAAALIGLNTPLLPPAAVIVAAIEEAVANRRTELAAARTGEPLAADSAR
jgi:hypothetical protein